jgi:hypothetical protein
MNSDEKLDQIICLLKKQNDLLEKLNSTESLVDAGLEDAKEYMMKNFNIKWLGDDIEEDIYDAIITVIKKFI